MKKPAIITKVHIVRVMKVCFFFSYSDCCGFWKIGTEGHISHAKRANTQQRIFAHLFRYRSRVRDVAIFAGARGLRGAIADVGGHAQPPLTGPPLEPNITARLGHDRRKRKKGGKGQGKKESGGI